MQVSKFIEKLNKLENNTYVIEEEITVNNGVYEAELIHDNVNLKTLNVYTGPKLTGDRVQTYIISTPSLTPWKNVIKIFSKIDKLYISYETNGDTVEAEDINKVQDAILDTQNNLNNEIDRAKNAEKVLTDNLNNEVERAKNVEKIISDNLTNESNRAKNSEQIITNNLNNEVSRANGAENSITNNLNAEISRAKGAEKDLTDSLNATNNNLNNEINRAKSVEGTLSTNLANEVNRASNAENTITNNLNLEITRAKAAESSITNTINVNKPNWDDKYSRNEVDNKINQVVSNMDWKESVATYSDIAKTYSTPDDGWTVNVKDTDITYRYSGTSWIPISANSIPLATKDVDGKMSKQDKIDHDDMNSKKHVHSNKSIIDAISQSLLDAWNSAYTHISDTVRHITQVERDKWNRKQDNLGYTPVNKAGDTMNGRLIIMPGSNGGISFPNNSFGGSGDTATITLENLNGGEATEMTFTITNDGNDIFNFKVPDNNGMKVNRNTVWHAGNDGAGSGLDADKLQGKSPNDFAPSGFGLGGPAKDVGGCNLNTLQKTGFYKGCNMSNAPTNGWYYIIVISHEDSWSVQYLCGYGSGSTNNAPTYLYKRNLRSNVWDNWDTIYTSNNKPTPSDLGASANGHTHDDRYYTESESDAKYATKDQISKAGYGDMFKSTYDKDGDGIVDVAQSLKFYSVSTNGGGTAGLFTKIAAISITSQYVDGNAVVEITSAGSGNYTQIKGKLYFRVKQQSSLGTTPGIDLKISDSEVVSENNFIAVITQNTTSITTVELYYKTVQDWDTLIFTPIINTNIVFYNKQPLITTLPAGSKVNCANLKKQLTWNDVKGV
ncbi:pyocin knob domain-containing protein [Clostridium saccharobutylicum]|uniref:PI-PLC Y-box domain-containing protein n=1 Tax=Clostridium saccharobutylicum DSM 13864 TaxID=1345695 RepID=U5MXZ9_CLOSA|nr:pyocin knob domain-containing protein [Clostridium saccharobutylicum]AGX44501.1 hypothetical protein CLSA_c35400 [Clostridium saccharobutylicum DSM 13864]AQR91795.1 hypothetical protein CLOSC_35230 [Clostridium saccharobutylicum]AQS01697.1 hypothetical protein CSACC_35280 [Clostridium saccharobutylicum]AQS15680.1 hypothetical protein CLOSACC_35280 [Clostridium saccharobutylicum]MBA2907457.1 hypothetical protein [Clostridium saccharobutylicum]